MPTAMEIDTKMERLYVSTLSFFFLRVWLLTLQHRPVLVEKPIPLEFDMGNLCAFDTNPLDPAAYKESLEQCLQEAARDGAQALINQVLTTITLKSTPDGVYAELPEPVTPLPREKPIPKAKEPTKWYADFPHFRQSSKSIADHATGSYSPRRRASRPKRRMASSSTTRRRANGFLNGATRVKTRMAKGTGSLKSMRRSRKRGPARRRMWTQDL